MDGARLGSTEGARLTYKAQAPRAACTGCAAAKPTARATRRSPARAANFIRRRAEARLRRRSAALEPWQRQRQATGRGKQQPRAPSRMRGWPRTAWSPPQFSCPIPGLHIRNRTSTPSSQRVRHATQRVRLATPSLASPAPPTQYQRPCASRHRHSHMHGADRPQPWRSALACLGPLG